MKLDYVATCLFGMEKFIADDLAALGYEKTGSFDGRVFFTGDEGAAARCNLWLHTAESLYIEVGRKTALSFDELFEATAALPWENFIGKADAFPVSGHCIKSKLFSVPDCQKIVKRAIVKRLSAAYGISWFEESGAPVKVEFFLFKDVAYLMIDTSGTGLHKRGYRPAAGEAPLRETLAAGLARIARLDAETMLWDPMCGSGTIAVEAARMLRNVAPGLDRHFAFEAFPWYPARLVKTAREEALDAIDKSVRPCIFGTDVDESVLATAAENARRGRVADDIRFFKLDVRKLYDPKKRGTIITNPPYGERLMTPREAMKLYAAMGTAFARLERWHFYILCGNESFEEGFGTKADKVRKLYNGMLKCGLYEYFRR